MTATAQADARSTNWRYVVPGQPPRPVVVGTGSTPLGAVLAGPAAGALAVPDLGLWAGQSGAGTRRRLRTRRVLVDLCAHAAPGGWVCIGFANRWYPASAFARGSLGLGTVRRVLEGNGLEVTATYLALPDHRHPALLVPAERRAELDHVLRRMLVTYVPAGARFPGLARRALWALRATALRTPHRLRRRLLPGYVVVARRPA